MPRKPLEDRLVFFTDEVAELFGVTEKQVKEWGASGLWVKPVRFGRSIRWPKDAILSVVVEQNVPSSGEMALAERVARIERKLSHG